MASRAVAVACLLVVAAAVVSAQTHRARASNHTISRMREQAQKFRELTEKIAEKNAQREKRGQSRGRRQPYAGHKEPCPSNGRVYKWGENCENTCGRCNSTPPCDRNTGHCPSGCQIGFAGVLCIHTCHPGTWGENCATKCGHCMYGAACSHSSGACVYGCDPGFLGFRCQIVDRGPGTTISGATTLRVEESREMLTGLPLSALISTLFSIVFVKMI